MLLYIYVYNKFEKSQTNRVLLSDIILALYIYMNRVHGKFSRDPGSWRATHLLQRAEHILDPQTWCEKHKRGSTQRKIQVSQLVLEPFTLHTEKHTRLGKLPGEHRLLGQSVRLCSLFTRWKHFC